MSTLFDNNDSVDPDSDHEQDVDYVAMVAQSLGKRPEELTVQDLAKKAAHGDRHINRLENDLDALRSEYNQTKPLEELLSEIKKLRPQEASNQVVTPPGEGSSKVEGMKEEDVMRLLQNERVKAIQDQNIAQVRDSLESSWGKGYRTKLKEVGADLNLSEEEMGTMAARNPKAFMKLVGADVKPSGQVNARAALAPVSGVRTPTSSSPERDYSYYKKLHKENPNLYWDPKTRQQMYADLEKHGPEAFLKINQN